MSPSLSSGMLVVCIAVSVFVVQGLAFINHNQYFHDLLFGPYGISTALVSSTNSFSIVRHTLNSVLAYNIAVILAAAIIGVATYELLEVGKNVTQGALELRSSDASALKEKLARLFVRVAALTTWAFYVLFFATLFIPFFVTILQNGIVQVTSGNPNGWPLLALTIGGMSLALHLHITFLRLAFLRFRLWKPTL
ncbi:MAG TPA: hypothetical protein VNX65_04655 [Patescibacteria group bacterium]|nr:hypothetical protein [Patescibacteria group bacterium]